MPWLTKLTIDKFFLFKSFVTAPASTFSLSSNLIAANDDLTFLDDRIRCMASSSSAYSLSLVPRTNPRFGVSSLNNKKLHKSLTTTYSDDMPAISTLPSSTTFSSFQSRSRSASSSQNAPTVTVIDEKVCSPPTYFRKHTILITNNIKIFRTRHYSFNFKLKNLLLCI